MFPAESATAVTENAPIDNPLPSLSRGIVVFTERLFPVIVMFPLVSSVKEIGFLAFNAAVNTPSPSIVAEITPFISPRRSAAQNAAAATRSALIPMVPSSRPSIAPLNACVTPAAANPLPNLPPCKSAITPPTTPWLSTLAPKAPVLKLVPAKSPVFSNGLNADLTP
jgi:hypothetical protein